MSRNSSIFLEIDAPIDIGLVLCVPDSIRLLLYLLMNRHGRKQLARLGALRGSRLEVAGVGHRVHVAVHRFLLLAEGVSVQREWGVLVQRLLDQFDCIFIVLLLPTHRNLMLLDI